MERWYPLLAGLAAAAVAWALRTHVNIESQALSNLMGSVLNLSSIAVGFLGASAAILLSIDQRRVIRDLKKMGSYNRLIDYLISAVRWSFGLAVFSAIGGLAYQKLDGVPHARAGFFLVWFFLCVVSAVACYRIVYIFADVLRVQEDQGTKA
jgi:hypothetical protein